MGESINGETVSSKTLSHITSYPVVSESISTFKSNPYGAKSLSYADAGYAKFVKPTIPYLAKPYSYVSPYAAKLDEFGDNILTKVDDKVPVVKTETKDIKATATSYYQYPFNKAGETKKYVFDTYSTEHKKCGEGYVASGKAVIASGLVITSDVLTWVSGFLGTKKGEAKDLVKEKTSN